MAHIRKLGKDRWQARYIDPTGRERAKNFRYEWEARDFLTNVEGRKMAGGYVDPKHGRVPVGEFIARIPLRPNRAPSTQMREEWLVRKLILPTFERVPLSDILPETIQGWVNELHGKAYAPDTVAKAYQTFARILDAAVAALVLARSPARAAGQKITLPRAEEIEHRYLSPDEITALAEVIESRYGPFVYVGALAGLRPGESAALRVNRVDFLRRSIRVVETLSETGGRITFRPVKTRYGRRTLKVPPSLVDILAAHIREFPPRQDGLIFTGPKGAPLSLNRFRKRAWAEAVRTSVGEPCTPHDLRHTNVALLIASGVHPKAIQMRLGHASIKTTLDIYGHLFEGVDEAAADALDRHFEEALSDRSASSDGFLTDSEGS